MDNYGYGVVDPEQIQFMESCLMMDILDHDAKTVIELCLGATVLTASATASAAMIIFFFILYFFSLRAL